METLPQMVLSVLALTFCLSAPGAETTQIASNTRPKPACAWDPVKQECSATEISCDAGASPEGCSYGNYCLPKDQEDGCPTICPNMCNWETEISCEKGVDMDGCWIGNFCQKKIGGECPLNVSDRKRKGKRKGKKNRQRERKRKKERKGQRKRQRKRK